MSGEPALKDLRPLGPLGALDAAVALLRRGDAALLGPAWAGGTVLAAVVVVLYYVERVEGVSVLRLPFAALLLLAWCLRAQGLGRAARHGVVRLWPAHREHAKGRWVDLWATALVAALGLWVWLWVLAVASLAGPVGVLLTLPLLAVRGLVAPGWVAHAACAGRGGPMAIVGAARDNATRWGRGFVIELLMIVATFGLALNLYVLIALLLLLSRTYLGLDVATVESFVGLSNPFVILVIGALAVVLMEPLRAALSATTYVEARVREEGLDLEAALDEAIGHAARLGGGLRGGAVAAALALAFGLGAPAALAQAPAGAAGSPSVVEPGAPDPAGVDLAPDEPGAGAEPSLSAADERALEQMDRILERDEFREFEDRRGEGVAHLLERLFRWLMQPRDVPEVEAPVRVPLLPLPSGAVFLAIALALLLAVGLYLAMTVRRRRKPEDAAEGAAEEDPRDRSPDALLAEAGARAGRGDLRAAMRSLYLATLVSLDRRRLITFDAYRTNWAYLRQMPPGASRDAFREFTRLFDHKWYGEEPTRADEFEACRRLAEAIVADGEVR
ncbi:MAG: DUF4129 domain-containing protein [Sandaracinaceae bacterium]